MNKKLLFLTCAGLLSLSAIASTPPANEVEFRGLLVEKPVNTNFQSYWYISAGGGGSQILSTETTPGVKFHNYLKEVLDTKLSSTFSVSVGNQLKSWFGLQINLGSFNFTDNFTSVNTGLDLTFDVKNIFKRKYNEDSFFNPVLHVGGGYTHNSYTDNNTNYRPNGPTQEDFIFGKGGLQLNFRLSKQISLWLDGSVYLFNNDFDRTKGPHGGGDHDGASSYQIGLTYKFNKRCPQYRINPREVELVNDELNRLRKQVDECDQIQWLRKELEDCQNKPVPAPIVVSAPVVQPSEAPKVLSREEVIAQYSDFEPVFFTIDSYVVRTNQLVQIENVAAYIKAHPNAKVQLAAYADKKTGNAKHNLKLSQNRVNAVADVLVRKYGVSASSLSLLYFGDNDQPFEINELNRSVVFKLIK